jgi:hypothetical protein
MVVGGIQNVIVIAGNKYNTDAQSSARVDTELGPSKKASRADHSSLQSP